MCGRFFTAIEREDIQKIIDAVNRAIKDREKLDQMKTGEIFPTNITPVYISEGGEAMPSLMRWGFPGYLPRGSKATKAPPIINARSETVGTLPSFKKYLHQRCLVPANKYFEWAKNVKVGKKPKIEFRPMDAAFDTFWMAGIYRLTEENGDMPVFTILTMEASTSVAPIHDRMPVILGGKDARRAWMNGEQDLHGLFRDTAVRDMHKTLVGQVQTQISLI